MSGRNWGSLYSLFSDEAQAWRTEARCSDVKNAGYWFFPSECGSAESRDRKAVAKRWCAVCKVKAECLDYARAAGETVGVWGGEDFG